jgi:hypothetical protein
MPQATTRITALHANVLLLRLHSTSIQRGITLPLGELTPTQAFGIRSQIPPSCNYPYLGLWPPSISLTIHRSFPTEAGAPMPTSYPLHQETHFAYPRRRLRALLRTSDSGGTRRALTGAVTGRNVLGRLTFPTTIADHLGAPVRN